MKQDEQREMAIRLIVDLLRSAPFSMEYEVAENPKGVRIIYEVTQDEMDAIVNGQLK